MKHPINNPNQPRTPYRRLLRSLALALAGTALSHLATAAAPLAPPAFASKTLNVGSPTFRMNTAGSTPAIATPAMVQAHRDTWARVGKNAVGAGLIAFDVLNSPISPTPDAERSLPLMLRHAASFTKSPVGSMRAHWSRVPIPR